MHSPAQMPPPQPDPLMQLMLSQPSIDISTNVEVRATFDPPVIPVGGTAIFRVTLSAMGDSIRWPEDIYTPPELQLKVTTRGQILQPGAQLRPATTINHRVTATKPGTYTIPEFKARVYGRAITVPATTLRVAAPGEQVPPPPVRLFVDLPQTNVFSGQPVPVRVFMPATGGNTLQALQQLQLNGDGILVDQTSVRQRIQTLEFQGRSGPVFIYEAMLTPLVSGRLELTAQAFTAGNQFTAPIVIQGNTVIPGGPPQYVLLDSDPVPLYVEPLPRAGELPGFSGAIGEFNLDTVQLATNEVRVGETVKLFVTFSSPGELKRLLPPPPPAVTNWQIVPATPVGGPVLTATGTNIFTAITFTYQLRPLTNHMTATPVIPFSYFDPHRRAYVDLSVPALPITVRAGEVSAEAQALAQAVAAFNPQEPELKLSPLALTPGAAVGTLQPLQLRAGFWGCQLLPAVGFAAVYGWERRRRFYERHPDVLVRRRARRALRRERQQLRRAARPDTAARYAQLAVSALRIGSAPHFPAAPRALVGRDVLALLPAEEQNGPAGAVVRLCFAAEDARAFGGGNADVASLLTHHETLERVLDQLEARL